MTPYGSGWGKVRKALEQDELTPASMGQDILDVSDLAVRLVPDLPAFRNAFPRIRPPLPARKTRILLIAAQDALADSGRDLTRPHRDIGVMVSSTWGSDDASARLLDAVLRSGPRRASPLLFSQSVANAPVGAVAQHLGTRGPHLCTMGGGAIYLAFNTVARGETKAVICGGVEELEVNRLMALIGVGAFASDASAAPGPPHGKDVRPTPGEGAILMAFEDEEHARMRGAKVYAEVLAVHRSIGLSPKGLDAWGTSCGGDLTECVRCALSQAGITSESVGLFVGGRSGLSVVEEAEKDCLRNLELDHLNVHSLKRHLGESLAMAGAASVAWAADVLHRGQVSNATMGRGSGLSVCRGSHALVTNIEYEGHYFAAVLSRYSP